MNLQEIKSIPIVAYLRKLGISPVSETDYRTMYLAPYRKDTNPSLKVDKVKNLWIDYAIGKGGSIIDLVMQLKKCDFKTALDILAKDDVLSFSFHRNQSTESVTNIEVKKVKALENKALLQYLDERCIDLDIAKQYCKEIYYTINTKQYFAIGFQNQSLGYELRNKYYKGCTKKDITIISNEKNEKLCVFEGFIDMLSYTTHSKDTNSNFLVLNSVSQINKGRFLFDKYKTIELYLDNDEVGFSLTDQLMSDYSNMKDCSSLYADYKDFNEFLIERKNSKILLHLNAD